MKRKLLAIMLAAVLSLSIVGGAAAKGPPTVGGCKEFGAGFVAGTARDLGPGFGEFISGVASSAPGAKAAMAHDSHSNYC
jgi:hypothetical protein